LRANIHGGILVLCNVGGVKRKSTTLDKQMIRYELPILVFINNLDHKGANPWEVLNQARSKLQHFSAAVQVPIGLEDDFKGLVDLVELKAYSLNGSSGSVSETSPLVITVIILQIIQLLLIVGKSLPLKKLKFL
jgi:elongation factor G